MTATATHTGPAAAGFKELARIDEFEASLNKRLAILNDELAPIGWRGRPATPAIPGVRNRDPGVAPSGRIGDLLRAIPQEQIAAAREGRTPDVEKIEAALTPLEQRSEELRNEIRVLLAERRRLPERRTAVVRRYYSQFVSHARQVAREKSGHADQLIELARQVLADRADVHEAIALAARGKPIGMPEWQSAAIASQMSASFAPWTTSNRPVLLELWRAIETIADVSFAVERDSDAAA